MFQLHSSLTCMSSSLLIHNLMFELVFNGCHYEQSCREMYDNWRFIKFALEWYIKFVSLMEFCAFKKVSQKQHGSRAGHLNLLHELAMESTLCWDANLADLEKERAVFKKGRNTNDENKCQNWKNLTKISSIVGLHAINVSFSNKTLH